MGRPVKPGRADPPRRRGGRRALGLVAALTMGLLIFTAWAADYYLAPRPDRVRHSLHAWLKPSGTVGQTAGIIALSLFLFLWLYPLRKNVRWLRWTGAMAAWLDIHVAAALLIPVLTAVHASWRFDGLIGLGYWSMIVVCASGVVGRYLYIHIPRSASGLELTAEEIAAERRDLLAAVATGTGLPLEQVESILQTDPTPCEGLGIRATVARMLRDEVSRWRAGQALRRLCRRRAGGRLDERTLRRVLKLARREMALTQQARMLSATQRIFRLWHVAHRPFAITALVAVVVHVSVAVWTGMTWFW